MKTELKIQINFRGLVENQDVLIIDGDNDRENLVSEIRENLERICFHLHCAYDDMVGEDGGLHFRFLLAEDLTQGGVILAETEKDDSILVALILTKIIYT